MGALIFNGHAYGYTDASDTKVIRRQRVFCSNRGYAPGCGHSYGLFPAHRVPGYRVSTAILWQFAALLILGLSAYAAFHQLTIDMHVRAASRWRRRIQEAQSTWRTVCSRRAPPERVAYSSAFIATLHHLRSCFCSTDVFATYQHSAQAALFSSHAA